MIHPISRRSFDHQNIRFYFFHSLTNKIFWQWFLGSTDGKVIQNTDEGYKITNKPDSEKGYESVLEVEKQMTNQVSLYIS